MKPAWYIINYHNIDWEDSLLTRALGSTIRPDVFRAQLEYLSVRGDLLSVDQAIERLHEPNGFSRPAFSLWFDDGFSGVWKYALPICREFQVTPALSVNSRFVQHTEMFWRAKLACLSACDGLRSLRSQLRKHHADVPSKIRSWSLTNFSQPLVEMIDHSYNRVVSKGFVRDAFRIFTSPEQLTELAENGWLITNHSAAHYPLSEGRSWHEIQQDFSECESLVRRYNPKNNFWVIPFDWNTERYLDKLTEQALIVRVTGRPNDLSTYQSRVLYRHEAPLRRTGFTF